MPASPKVLITASRSNDALFTAATLARSHPPTRFDVASSVEDADIVLYVEYGYTGLADLPRLIIGVNKAPAARHFFFSEADWPFPVLPGAYPSLHRPCRWAHSWAYLPRREMDGRELALEPKFLFSFLGRRATHPIRKTIVTLDAPETPCLDIADALRRFPGYEYSQTYRSLIAQSKFVLCPRGFGASSIRIFEAMSSGRVPVIISDQWQRPPGISWESFSLSIPEANVLDIPIVLKRAERDAQEMGRLALEAFNLNFSPEIFFDRLLESLLSHYSQSKFSTASNLGRTCQSIGWREIKTVGSQTKSLALNVLRGRK
jgi:hypothetical protein